jgi:hypothetical protein
MPNTFVYFIIKVVDCLDLAIGILFKLKLFLMQRKCSRFRWSLLIKLAYRLPLPIVKLLGF